MSRVELTEKIIGLVIWILIAGGLFYLVVHPSLAGVSYDNVCKYNYGRDYIYESDRNFGRYCVELVYENLTKENPKPFTWTGGEIKEMCNIPRVWELTRWDYGFCDGGYKDER